MPGAGAGAAGTQGPTAEQENEQGNLDTETVAGAAATVMAEGRHEAADEDVLVQRNSSPQRPRPTSLDTEMDPSDMERGDGPWLPHHPPHFVPDTHGADDAATTQSTFHPMASSAGFEAKLMPVFGIIGGDEF